MGFGGVGAVTWEKRVVEEGGRGWSRARVSGKMEEGPESGLGRMGMGNGLIDDNLNTVS